MQTGHSDRPFRPDVSRMSESKGIEWENKKQLKYIEENIDAPKYSQHTNTVVHKHNSDQISRTAKCL